MVLGSHPSKSFTFEVPRGLRSLPYVWRESAMKCSSQLTSEVMAFLIPRSIPNKAGTRVTHPSSNPAALDPPVSLTQALPAPSRPRGWASVSLRGISTEPLGEFQAPRLACHLNLASLTAAQERWHADWEAAQNPLVFFPRHCCPGQPPVLRNALLYKLQVGRPRCDRFGHQV